jgi:hypothetical protein
LLYFALCCCLLYYLPAFFCHFLVLLHFSLALLSSVIALSFCNFLSIALHDAPCSLVC